MTIQLFEVSESSEIVPARDGYDGDFALTFQTYRQAGYSHDVAEAASTRTYAYARFLAATATGIKFEEMLEADSETRDAWFGAYDKVRTALMKGFHFGQLAALEQLRG